MASTEEEDYMSDAFLAKCADTRPGLAKGRAAVQNKKEERHKKLNEANRTKPRKVLEEEKREEALDKAISSDNKGFMLLQKMGYKQGTALGKKGEGRSEPIRVEVKSDRKGLGQAAQLKRNQDAIAKIRAQRQLKRQRVEENLTRDFRSRLQEKRGQKEAERDLYLSQKVCHQLDSEQNIESPAETFFWPSMKTTEDEEQIEANKDEDDASEPELTVGEQLQMLTCFLRTSYLYCIWCGVKYEDEDDLSSNCPGDTSEDHD